MTDHTQRLPCACSQIAASFHTDCSGHDTSGLTQLLNARTWQARHQNSKTPTSIGKLHFLASPKRRLEKHTLLKPRTCQPVPLSSEGDQDQFCCATNATPSTCQPGDTNSTPSPSRPPLGYPGDLQFLDACLQVESTLHPSGLQPAAKLSTWHPRSPQPGAKTENGGLSASRP
jgi:hypothetical protein